MKQSIFFWGFYIFSGLSKELALGRQANVVMFHIIAEIARLASKGQELVPVLCSLVRLVPQPRLGSYRRPAHPAPLQLWIFLTEPKHDPRSAGHIVKVFWNECGKRNEMKLSGYV